METTRTPSTSRLLFLDNLRYLAVLLVVAFHVSAGYSGMNEFYMETGAGGFFLGLRHFLASLPLMHLLFFVAGYFAVPSLGTRGYGIFLWKKIYRLGLPLLLCILFLGPLMPFMGYYSQSFNGLSTASYWDFWRTFVSSGFDSWLIKTAFTTNPQFHHMHYWFLSILLQFFIFFALLHAAWKKWGPTPETVVENAEKKPAPITRDLLLAGLLIAVVRIITQSLDLPHGLFAFFFYDPLSNIFTYGGFFALGIFAHTRGWFVDGQAPGLRTFGIITGLMVLLCLVGFGIYKIGGEETPRIILNTISSLFESLLVLWFLVIAIGLTYRYMNRPSAVNASLAANSYVIYLIHYPLILIFRLPLLSWDVSTFFKWPFVLLLTLISSYALSEYLIRPRTRLAVAGLIGLNILLFTFGVPRTSYSHILLDRQNQFHQVIPADVRPEQTVQELPDTLDGRFRSTPRVKLSWQNSSLYFAYSSGGLRLLSNDASIDLAPELEIGALAPLPGGSLAAVDPSANRIFELDREGQLLATLVDSSDSTGTPQHLVADADKGIYFTVAEKEREGKIYYRRPDGQLLVVAQEGLSRPGGLALNATGSVPYANDAGGGQIWAFDIATDGALSNRRSFAELFLADARYGIPRIEPVDCRAEGMVADAEGRLYVATRFGIQVFSPKGTLLGLVTFPTLSVSWNPKRPLTCVFGGPDLSILYASCGDEIFSIRTRTTGFQHPTL